MKGRMLAGYEKIKYIIFFLQISTRLLCCKGRENIQTCGERTGRNILNFVLQISTRLLCEKGRESIQTCEERTERHV